LAGIALSFQSCKSGPEPVKAAKIEDSKPQIVAVQLPAKRSMTSSASLTAEFRAYQQVDLFAKTAGYLRRIHVDVGSNVREGELIAVLESPELDADLQQAGAQRKRAESEKSRAEAELPRINATVSLAKASLERLQNVNKTEAGLVALQEIDNAVARLREAEGQIVVAKAQVAAAADAVDAAKAQEARARTMLEYTKVTAPFRGVVTQRFAHPGAMIQAGVASSTQALPLVRLAELDRLRLAAFVPEAVAGRLQPGQSVDVRVPSLNMQFPAKVARFTGNVQQNTRTAEIEIDVPNPGRKFLPGMIADVTWRAESRDEVLTVPMQSVSNLGGNRYVLIVNDSGVLEERQIRTGVESASDAEVLEGLSGNERIVTSSRNMLRVGMRVEARSPGSQAESAAR
jgi:RND family efflux transporter MFP subunit